jgi:hypothetical protein
MNKLAVLGGNGANGALADDAVRVYLLSSLPLLLNFRSFYI